MYGEQDGIWKESVFIFFVLLVCVQGILGKITEGESDIAGNIRKFGKEISVDVSSNGDRGLGVGSALKQLNSVSCTLWEGTVLFSKIRYLPAATQILYQVSSCRLEICVETDGEIANVKCW